MVAVALELQNAVDEVLEHARAGDGAVLRHVADQDRRDTALLRDAQQASRRFADLRDRARRGSELGGVERLHGIDHAHGGPLALERRADGLELRLREDLHVRRAAETRGAKLHLRHRLLACDEQRTSRLAHRPERHQQQRGLPDARLTADEDERGRNEASAEDAIELWNACPDAIGLRGVDVDESQHGLGARGAARRPAPSSTSVPNASQPGHLPNQRPAV